MKINSEKKKSLIISFCLLVFVLLVVFLVIKPAIRKVYEQKDLLAEDKLTLERESENVEKYREDLEFLREELSYHKNLKIDEKNGVKLIELLEKMALENDLNLRIEIYKKSSKKVKKEATEKTFLKLALSGDYRDSLVFLYKLENFTYPVGIESLLIKSFEESRIKNRQEEDSLSNLPEIESELIISF